MTYLFEHVIEIIRPADAGRYDYRDRHLFRCRTCGERGPVTAHWQAVSQGDAHRHHSRRHF